jgi:catechol 2,3-dioxygenase-like lactoylglutathione lyase family enzyme
MNIIIVLRSTPLPKTAWPWSAGRWAARRSWISLPICCARKGADVAPGTAEQCDASKVKKLYRYTCPMIGCPTEIYYGPLVSHTSFTPRRGISGYKTGTLGLGHIAFWVKDLEATLSFYREVMGFSISDYIAWDDNDAVFLHCNPRHHTLALMAEAEGRPAGKFQHLMVESVSRDDVGYGYDIVRGSQHPGGDRTGQAQQRSHAELLPQVSLRLLDGIWLWRARDRAGLGGQELRSAHAVGPPHGEIRDDMSLKDCLARIDARDAAVHGWSCIDRNATGGDGPLAGGRSRRQGCDRRCRDAHHARITDLCG